MALSNVAVPDCDCHTEPRHPIPYHHWASPGVVAWIQLVAAYMPDVMPPPWLPASQISQKWENMFQDIIETCDENFTLQSYSPTEKSVTVQKINKRNNKCVSRFARRITLPQYTALIHAAACNSQCPATVAAVGKHSRRVGWRPALLMPPPPWLPTSQRSPKGEKSCSENSRPTRMQNFTPLALSAAEKSVTVQIYKQTKKQENQQKIKVNKLPLHNTVLWWYKTNTQ